MKTTLLFVVAALLTLPLSAETAMKDAPADRPEIQYAKALRPGDTIMFVAPAGELIEKRVALAKKNLEAMGFKVIVPEDLFRQRGYLAGDDQTRADELMRAFADPEVDAIFPGTGGYGTTRILDLLDFEVIAANPKVFIGFSDITALHTAIHQKTGLITFHSPNPQWGLGSDNGFHPIAEKYWWRAILAKAYEKDSDGPGWVYDFKGMEDAPQVETVAPGVGQGRVIGGNVSLNEVYIKAGPGVVVTPMAPQRASDFSIGQMVSFDVRDGATIELGSGV